MTGNGFEFVAAAYGLTAVVLVTYGVGLWVRLVRENRREREARAPESAREATHV